MSREYTVKEVAALSGVSVRTLHYYDKISLLKPLRRTSAGYRYYGENELLILQQILFYKELDFPLEQIQSILTDPNSAKIPALQNQKVALREKIKRLNTILATIDKTIQHLSKEKIMKSPDELYQGLNTTEAKKIRSKAMQKYGIRVVENSENELLKLGKEGFEILIKSQKENARRLFSLRHEDPHSDVVQLEIAGHYQIIRQFWGTSINGCDMADAYSGLGKLYLEDERFTSIEGISQPEYAHFLEQAMQHYAATKLRKE